MPRIKLDFPDTVNYTFICPVRIGDINYGGHLGNDAVLSIVHETRLQFLQKHGMSEMDIGGAGIIMTDSIVSYQAEVFYGATLEIDIAPGEISTSYFELFYRLRNAGVVACTVKTGFVCFDYEKRRVVTVPEKLATMLLAARAESSSVQE